MASTPWLSTSDASSYPVPGWNFMTDVDADDGYHATVGVYGFSATIRTGGIQLLNPTQMGTDLAGTNTTVLSKGTDTDITFGGPNELWGLSLTPADVNSSSFGVSWKDNQGGPYIMLTGFGAAVPAGSIISGVEVTVQGKQGDNGTSHSYTMLDVVQMRIHYNTDHTITGGGQANGGLLQEIEEEDNGDKLFQHKIYDKGTFLGEWSDEVASEPEFKEQINTIGTTMPIKLGRGIDSLSIVPETLLDETGDTFLAEDGDTLIGLFSAGTGVGTGSDADVNYDVQVNAYYGGYDWLTTQDGEPLITQDYELIVVQDGAPEGRSLITGFISKWNTGYGGEEAINTNLMTYGWELNQTILETVSTTPLVVAPITTPTTSYGIASPAGTAVHTVIQTLTANLTGKLASIDLQIARGAPGSSKEPTGGPVTLTLYAGTSILGTELGTVTVTVPPWTHTNTSSSYEEYRFEFASYINLTNASEYTIKLTTTAAKGYDYPMYIREGAAYAGGSAMKIDGAGTVGATNIAFELNYGSGVTTVPFLSEDPSTIMKYIVDFAASKGCHIRYTEDSIDMTGTTVTYTFNTNKASEGINKVLELAPSDWYYYIDPADNTLYFKARPESPDHVFTLGRDIAKFEIERDMEAIINETYFSGGGDPALFLKTTNQASQDTWRRGTDKLSDNRVTSEPSAQIISESHINRNKEPIYKVKMTIAAAVYDIESIRVGQLVGYRGFANFIDELELQISEKVYKRDTVELTLGTLRPAVPKRLEDLRRNLDVLEQQNNPTGPN